MNSAIMLCKGATGGGMMRRSIIRGVLSPISSVPVPVRVESIVVPIPVDSRNRSGSGSANVNAIIVNNIGCQYKYHYTTLKGSTVQCRLFVNKAVKQVDTKVKKKNNNRTDSNDINKHKNTSKAKSRNDTSHASKQHKGLINEHLIRFLLQQQQQGQTADTLQVRLLVDERQLQSIQSQSQQPLEQQEHDLHDTDDDDTEDEEEDEEEEEEIHDNNEFDSKSQPKNASPTTTVKLISLTEAIQIATSLNVDLIGISLQQNQQSIPVIRAMDYSKFLYSQTIKLTKQKKSILKNQKSNKEFNFRAGIDSNDLQRKVNQMVDYLQKGHSCSVIITSKRRNLIDDQNVIQTTLHRIEEYVGEYGNRQGTLKVHPNGNRGSLLFQPKSSKK